MDGLYFLAMLVGIGWLAAWSIRPEPHRRDALGWLFDMAGAGEGAPEERPRHLATVSWRKRAAEGMGATRRAHVVKSWPEGAAPDAPRRPRKPRRGATGPTGWRATPPLPPRRTD